MNVNFMAVLIAAIIQFALGMFWYSPAAFGKKWMSLIGLTEAKMKEMQKKGDMPQKMIIGFISGLVMSYVLAVIVAKMGARTLETGAMVGFWVWLGFFATSQLGTWLWEGKPFKLYKINTGFYLVALVINGALIAMWP